MYDTAQIERYKTQVRVIRRFQNRKLYDTVQSCYVTLPEIADLFNLGQNIKVVDHKTKQDITYNPQIQVLFSQEKNSFSGEDVELMNKVIRSREGTFTGYIRELEGLPFVENNIANDLTPALSTMDSSDIEIKNDLDQLLKARPVENQIEKENLPVFNIQ